MIVADSSVWIDHLNSEDAQMRKHLNKWEIAMHPFVAGELALGSLRDRKNMLEFFDSLPQIDTALTGEVRQLIETNNLFSRGIGWTDAHLIAAVLLNPGTKLWTRDKALRRVAEALNCHVTFK